MLAVPGLVFHRVVCQPQLPELQQGAQVVQLSQSGQLVKGDVQGSKAGQAVHGRQRGNLVVLQLECLQVGQVGQTGEVLDPAGRQGGSMSARMSARMLTQPFRLDDVAACRLGVTGWQYFVTLPLERLQLWLCRCPKFPWGSGCV